MTAMPTEREIEAYEAALAGARKVIEPFSDIAGEMFARNWNNGQVAIALDNPGEPHRVLFEHFVAARDWLTRNRATTVAIAKVQESPNAK